MYWQNPASALDAIYMYILLRNHAHVFCCPLDHPNAVVIVPMTTPGAGVASSARRSVQFIGVRRSKALSKESKLACRQGIGRGAEDLAITSSRT